jgi:hypothetical protein
MKTRTIPQQLKTEVDLGFKNLLVSGCSFTYNNSESSAVTWPYYLRDLANFDQVYDCSLPGAGNYHILNSTIWAVEQQEFDKNTTLVIVMWSSHCRDDAIIATSSLSEYPMQFNYTQSVSTGITGGGALGNNRLLSTLQTVKSLESRAVENYLYITALYNYLLQKQYNFVFLDYLDRSIPNRGNDFLITDYLLPEMAKKYQHMFANNVENIYKFSIQRDLLNDDDFHPSPNGHLSWTRQVLLPALKINCRLGRRILVQNGQHHFGC